MDQTNVIASPCIQSGASERAVAEVTAAIELVRSGAAGRVRLVALAENADLPAIALACAQAANIAFAVEERPGPPTLTFGPRVARR